MTITRKYPISQNSRIRLGYICQFLKGELTYPVSYVLSKDICKHLSQATFAGHVASDDNGHDKVASVTSKKIAMQAHNQRGGKLSNVLHHLHINVRA